MSGTRRSHDREWNRARSDPLTGLVNEQAFYDNATAAAKVQQWGILAYVDLDGFKQINDRHGHAAGARRYRPSPVGARLDPIGRRVRPHRGPRISVVSAGRQRSRRRLAAVSSRSTNPACPR
ncbi:diguanylate cyclase [Sphingomonas sp. PAMC26645]|nr:diguanylate cyclase [Sphingomonas sp. PAMC26645]